MRVEFTDKDLERLEQDARYDAGLANPIVRAFRKRMQAIRSAVDERDFFALRSMKFEKLKGQRASEYSMRLNNQWRLILKLEGKGKEKRVVIVSIEDYH